MAADLKLAVSHADAGEFTAAWTLIDEALRSNPNDVRALVLASYCCEKQGKLGLSYNLAKRAIDLKPNEPAAWTNAGRACDLLWRMEEAEHAYRQALKHIDTPRAKALNLVNISAVFLQLGQYERAKVYAEKALEVEPQNRKARHNLGLCQLAVRDWEHGWLNYHASIGSGQRYRWSYADEPEWQGESGGTVVVYGEQGIGDEICAASMYPDAIGRAGKVIMDCDKRLASLFRRSFPAAKVYGTRAQKEGLDWALEDQKIDYSLASMQLGGLFRLKDEDFPTKPYLVPDADKVLMWRALFSSKGKPAIGIAWTGGTEETAARYRSVTLEQLLPIFKAVDAHWVSLQYKDSPEIVAFRAAHPEIDLRQYPATTMKDYDETAGLVGAMDCVVSVPTSVVHLSVALGVKTIAMKSATSCWKFAGEKFIEPAQLIPNAGDWAHTISEAAKRLRNA